jgi:flagellar biosynthesis GTPase FlhF
MIIANPIYDSVFKYLMDDLEIARGLISAIIGEEVADLVLQPQETNIENLARGLTVFRLDFKAVIRTARGEKKKVLIELQKAKHLYDVMRFRGYLGKNYLLKDQVVNEGQAQYNALPILTIYFLGFRLDHVEVPVLKVDRVYRNAATGEVLHVREPFVEQLTHDSYAIQIPRLRSGVQNRLEKVLQVFSQEFVTDDLHRLNFRGDATDPLVQRLLDKLTRAVASEEVRLQMEVEDEIDRVFERELGSKNLEIAEQARLAKEERQRRKTAEKQREAAEKKRETAEKKQKAAEQQREEEKRQRETAEQQREAEKQQKEAAQQQLEALQREMEELKRKLDR